jgi:DNA-binding PadR family transcriptional regulator
MGHNQYLKGLLEPLILKLLKEEGRMYGYEITQRIKAQSANQVQITEGALYPMLHKMEAEGLVDVEMTLFNNRQRKYYKLTNKGKKASADAITSLQQFVEMLSVMATPKTQTA